MRRVIIGMAAAAVGLAVWLLTNGRLSLGFSAGIAAYAIADRLGLLPSPYLTGKDFQLRDSEKLNEKE